MLLVHRRMPVQALASLRLNRSIGVGPARGSQPAFPLLYPTSPGAFRPKGRNLVTTKVVPSEAKRENMYL